MKIALVSVYDFGHPGGVNLHCAHLAHEFTRRGHSVRIIAPCSRPDAIFGSDKLIPLGNPLAVPTAGTIARFTLSMRLSSKVKPVLEREKFDVIHLHEPLCPTLPTTILKFSNSKNIGTFHASHGSRRILGVSIADRAYTIFNRYVRTHWLNKLHDKIAVSQAALEFVAKHFPGKYHIIPNGIDLNRFTPDVIPIEEYRDGKLNILFVGRLEKRKGLKYLLAAYTKLKWDFPNIRLLVVGPGKLDPDSQRLLGERNPKDVVVVGTVSHDDLPRYYKTADIFCTPATSHESFGMVLLEAMAVGKPVVASNIVGYAGVVTDGVEGFLVPPKREDELASVLARLIQNESLRAELGERGLAHVQEYSWERVAERVMSVYNNTFAPTSQPIPVPTTA
ncbi:MAG: glycosyltransferase family 4 protein [Dehalococcoidia bacterium]